MSKLTFLLVALAGVACIIMGWNGETGVPIEQLALIWGGLALGHVITEALNDNGNESEGD
jgi:hypothetical protein